MATGREIILTENQLTSVSLPVWESNQQNVEQVNLSNRELEVLEHIAEGHSTNTIARELNISNNTVEFHRHNLMSKLQASNVANMVKRAMQMGLAFIKH